MKGWPWLHMIGEYTVHNFSTTSEIIGILVVTVLIKQTVPFTICNVSFTIWILCGDPDETGVEFHVDTLLVIGQFFTFWSRTLEP